MTRHLQVVEETADPAQRWLEAICAEIQDVRNPHKPMGYRWNAFEDMRKFAVAAVASAYLARIGEIDGEL